MKHPIPFILALAAILALGACGKTEEPAEEAAAPATGAAEETKSEAEMAIAEAKEKGKEAAGAAATAVTEMAESAREKGGEIAESAQVAGTEMADTASAQAEALIAKVKDYIANNEIDLAAEAMEKLQAVKASLPESAQAQIERLEQMLAGSKSGAEPTTQGQ